MFEEVAVVCWLGGWHAVDWCAGATDGATQVWTLGQCAGEGKEVVGISKLARTLEVYARRLQIQEKLTDQVADSIFKELNAKGVMVVIEAEHMCMTMRGIKKPGTTTVTMATRGLFEEEEYKNRFFNLLKL